MDDKTLQRKLDQLVCLANELKAEAVSRYGPNATLFYESEGDFHVMSGDTDGSAASRQEFVRFSSRGHCRMDCGAW